MSIAKAKRNKEHETPDLLGVAIIPAFNEAETIGKVVEATNKVLKNHFQNSTVIVVDDGSLDDTAAKAKLSGAMVIRLKKNTGVFRAFAVGKAFTKTLNPNIVVQLDADGQHNPEDIPRLLRPIMTDTADFVIGSRFLDSSGICHSRDQYKRLGNQLFSSLLSLVLKSKITDSQSGFRAWKFSLGDDSQIISNYTYVHESLIRAKHNGSRIIEIPINVNERRFGTSKVVRGNLKYGLLATKDISRVYLDSAGHSSLLLPLFQLFFLGLSFWLMVWFQVKERLGSSTFTP